MGEVCLVSVTVLGLFISMWTITDKIGANFTRNVGIWAGSQQPYSWRNLIVHLRLSTLNKFTQNRNFRTEKSLEGPDWVGWKLQNIQCKDVNLIFFVDPPPFPP